jgi:hypothetical protein
MPGTPAESQNFCSSFVWAAGWTPLAGILENSENILRKNPLNFPIGSRSSKKDFVPRVAALVQFVHFSSIQAFPLKKTKNW